MPRRKPLENQHGIERLCRRCSSVFIVAVQCDERIFCSMSCAASFNNTNRKRTVESRARTAATVKERLEKQGAFGVIKNPHRRSFPDLTLIRRASCTNCGIEFWSRRQRRVTTHYTRLCSDACFIKNKKSNATGIKRVHYKGFDFDSQWEVDVAYALDRVGIPWTRPHDAIPWIDNKGKNRRYYPDFYIPDLGIYLDPKNPYVTELQLIKIAYVSRNIHLIHGTPEKIISEVIDMWRSRADSNHRPSAS